MIQTRFEDFRYDFDRDKFNEKFEKVFAKNHLKNYNITNGYFPDYDIKDLDTGETYEVKRDYWFLITDNILVEEFFNLEEIKEGWVYHTKADYYVVFITDEIYYITNMRKVVNDFFNNKDTWSCIDIPQRYGFHTRNYLKNFEWFDIDFYKVKKGVAFFLDNKNTKKEDKIKDRLFNMGK